MWFKSKKFKELEKKYDILWNVHMKLLEEHEDLSDRASELQNEVNVLFEENMDKECKIFHLVKQLKHCWNQIESHNSNFSDIESSEINSKVNNALDAFLKYKEERTEEDNQNIIWLIQMIQEFEGKL